jgi:hypothetical protein
MHNLPTLVLCRSARRPVAAGANLRELGPRRAQSASLCRHAYCSSKEGEQKCYSYAGAPSRDRTSRALFILLSILSPPPHWPFSSVAFCPFCSPCRSRPARLPPLRASMSTAPPPLARCLDKLSTGCWIRLQHLPTSTHLFSSSLISSTLFPVLRLCSSFYYFVVATS